MVQGRALSRLHLAKGPDAINDAQSNVITSDDLLAAAKAVEMTDLEAGGREADGHTDRQGLEERDASQRGSSEAFGGKHVHMADAVSSGANQHGGNRSKEADKKATLWDDMLKRKVDADLEKQKRDGTASSLQDGVDRMAGEGSTASLLDPNPPSSDRVAETLPAPRHLPPLDHPRFLSKQGLMGALNSSRRFLPSLMKKTDGELGEAAADGGAGGHGGGSGGNPANSMETAGSMDSNAPLLPAGISSGNNKLSSNIHQPTLDT